MTLANKYEGKRVKYVGDENEYTGEYFPLPGTLGTCTGRTSIAPNGKLLICVKWDKGTKGDGKWYCYDTDLEIVEEDKKMFKVGQRVIYNSEYQYSKFYPPKGTKGTIVSILPYNCALVRWDEGTHDGCWYCDIANLILVEE